MAELGGNEFRGVMAAVLTPLNEDLSPDHGKWLDHCRWLLSQGCHGLAVLGTTSEANSFSLAERLAMLDAVGESDLAGNLFVPGTGCCAIPDSVALTNKALEIGAAGVLMLPPFYYKPVDDDGLFAAYSEIIQRVGDSRLRVLLYHIPQNSGVPISLGLIERLVAAYPDTRDRHQGFRRRLRQHEGHVRGVSRLSGFLGIRCLPARRAGRRRRRRDHRLQQCLRRRLRARFRHLGHRGWRTVSRPSLGTSARRSKASRLSRPSKRSWPIRREMTAGGGCGHRFIP